MNLFTGRQARPQASINSLKWLWVACQVLSINAIKQNYLFAFRLLLCSYLFLAAPLSFASYTQISAGGGYHTCGLKTNGSVICWGSNDYGQTTVPAGIYSQIDVGWYYTCGLKADGSVVCWGSNDDGQTTVPAGTYSQIDAGANHVCGLKNDGSVTCWGDSANDQLRVPNGIYSQVSAGQLL